MLTFRNTTIGLLLLAAVLWWLQAPAYSYALLLFVYTLVLVIGSYRVDSQFYMRVLCDGQTGKNLMALSFDDGPHPEHTAAILDILKVKQVPAAFFCIGKNIPGQEALLQRMVAEGHLLGNHSYGHQALFDLYPATRMEQDLQQMNALVESVVQLRPRLFRPPYGVTNPNLAAAVRKTGMTPVGWNIRSLDTVAKDGSALLDRIRRRFRKDGIILLHDTMAITRQILPELIDTARREGYEFVRPDLIINVQPYA